MLFSKIIKFTGSYALEINTTAAAAAAKSLQSCPTLCDPIDGRYNQFLPWKL